MKRQIGFVAVAVASLALLCQSADARGRRHHHHHGVDQRVAIAGAVVGTGATVGFLSLNHWNFRYHHHTAAGMGTGGAFAITTVGCMAVSPMLATVIVRRPLTMHEGHSLAAGCLLPIIGPWLVDQAYAAHPEWERY